MQEAAACQEDPIVAFKLKIKEQLQPEEYEGWIDSLEIDRDDKKITFRLSHPIFRDDIKKNHDPLFQELSKQLWEAEKVLYKVGKQSNIKQVKVEKVPKETSAKNTAAVIKLKFPPRPSEHHIEYPTDFTRVTPFKPLRPGKKREYISEVIFRNKFGYVKFSGQELGVDDEDVFMQLLDMAREQLKQNSQIITVTFFLKELLRKLNRSEGGKGIKWLHQSLERLSGGTMTYKSSRFKFIGGFVNNVGIDEETGKCFVELNAQIGKIYSNAAYTFIDFNQRLHLKRSTTKRLHAYLNGQRSKNKKIISYTDLDAKDFLQLNSNIREVRRILKQCHGELLEIGFIANVEEHSITTGKKYDVFLLD